MSFTTNNWGPGRMDRTGPPTGRHNTAGHSCLVAAVALALSGYGAGMLAKLIIGWLR